MTNSRPAKHTVVMTAKAEFLVFVCLFIWTRWFESQLYVIDRSLDSSGTVTACQVSTEAPGVQWVPLDDVIVLGSGVGGCGPQKVIGDMTSRRYERTIILF